MIGRIGLGLIFFFAGIYGWSQVSDWKKETMEFREELNEHYRDSSKSPLTDDQWAIFKSHQFFPARKSYYVSAKFERTPDEKPFEMPTSSGITKTFVRFGIAHFTLQGKPFDLNVYQSMKLAATEEYKNYLFLPFTDATTGSESYGGGRYIDLCIPDGDTLIINFNAAYNPYCAYSTGWNCPIVPKENDLPVEVKAGIKGVVGAAPEQKK